MKRRDVLVAACASLLAVKHLHAAAATRIVTIGGGITEIVYLLGGATQLVGTDTTSVYPDAANRTPKVGYRRQLSTECVLSLGPQVVVATHDAGPPVVLEQLRGAGVQVELVQADPSRDEVRRNVQAVGRALDKPREAAALRLDAQWRATQHAVRAAQPARPPALEAVFRVRCEAAATAYAVPQLLMAA